MRIRIGIKLRVLLLAAKKLIRNELGDVALVIVCDVDGTHVLRVLPLAL